MIDLLMFKFVFQIWVYISNFGLDWFKKINGNVLERKHFLSHTCCVYHPCDKPLLYQTGDALLSLNKTDTWLICLNCNIGTQWTIFFW